MDTFEAEERGPDLPAPAAAAPAGASADSNPLRLGAAADDSEATLAPDPGAGEAAPILLLVKVAAAVLATPVGVWLGVLIGVGLALVNISFIGEDPTAARVLSQLCRAVGDVLIMLPLFSLRRVTRDLYQASLGVGSTRITATAAARLKRWHAFLLACAVFAGLGWWGGFNIVWVGLAGQEDPYYEDYQIQPGQTALTAHQRAHALLLGMYSAYVAPLVYCAWYLSLKEASVLVRGEVVDCRTLISRTSATSAAWDTDVMPELLELIQVTLPTLSIGWSDGLLAVWAGLWVTAIGVFAKFVDGGNLGDLVFTLGAAALPLFLAVDVAGASSECETIPEALNAKRAADLRAENHVKLKVAESLLQNQNRGQGLGFVVGGKPGSADGKVVDKNTLKAIFAAMSGFLGTALPLIVAMASRENWIDDEFAVGTPSACVLSAHQITIIQSAMMERNATCSYNMSLDEILLL
eukprot:SAG22_NODE_533_length_9401_cov_5.643625_1_plen_466_part_00